MSMAYTHKENVNGLYGHVLFPFSRVSPLFFTSKSVLVKWQCNHPLYPFSFICTCSASQIAKKEQEIIITN